MLCNYTISITTKFSRVICAPSDLLVAAKGSLLDKVCGTANQILAEEGLERRFFN